MEQAQAFGCLLASALSLSWRICASQSGGASCMSRCNSTEPLGGVGDDNARAAPAARFSFAAPDVVARGLDSIVPAFDFSWSAACSRCRAASGNASGGGGAAAGFGAGAAIAGGVAGRFGVAALRSAGLSSSVDELWPPRSARRSPRASTSASAGVAACCAGSSSRLARADSVIGCTGTTRGAAFGSAASFWFIASWPMRQAMPAARTIPAAEPSRKSSVAGAAVCRYARRARPRREPRDRAGAAVRNAASVGRASPISLPPSPRRSSRSRSGWCLDAHFANLARMRASA